MDKIRIIDRNTQQELFSCPIEDYEKAYNYALFLEELEIDFDLSAPSLPETLAYSLGSEELSPLKNEIIREICSHNS